MVAIYLHSFISLIGVNDTDRSSYKCIGMVKTGVTGDNRTNGTELKKSALSTAPIVEEVSSKKKSAEPEIITLTDSEEDDDTDPPPAKRPANGQTTPAPPTPASSTAAPGSTTPQGSGRWYRGVCVSECVQQTEGMMEL